jgi:hypothetical protein
MSKIIVIIGMGELGELFARGFLKLGHPVYPVLRNMQLSDVVFCMLEAFSANPDHICRGRTATERLHRVLKHSEIAGISMPMLQQINLNFDGNF